jgi:hypothetical protein
MVAGSSCLPPDSAPASRGDASDMASGAPLVGRLQYQDRMVDLTVDAFADGPSGSAVDPSSYAKVIADIDSDVRGSRSDRPARGDDASAFPLAPVGSRLDFERR